jgi:uncharacterized membrane protein
VFVGLHALRLLVLGVFLGPWLRRRLQAELQDARARGDDAAVRRALRRFAQLRYGMAGLILGLVWGIRSNSSPWLHALRLLVVLVVAAPLLHWLRARRAERRGTPAGVQFPIRVWIAAKLVLLAVALGLQWLLERSMSREGAGWLVAAFIFVVVALGGPVMHRAVLRRRWRRPAGDPASSDS